MGKKVGWKTDISFLKQWRLISFQKVKDLFSFTNKYPHLETKREKVDGGSTLIKETKLSRAWKPLVLRVYLDQSFHFGPDSLFAEAAGVPFCACLQNPWPLLQMPVRMRTQSCPTLCDPMDCSPPGSSVHGIFQERILEWVAISFSRGSSRPGHQICVFCVSCTAGGFFTTSATWEV